jgi:hypothetical protein
MVVNNVNKFLVIILSELFIQRTLDGVASAGVIAVMLFGCLYAHSIVLRRSHKRCRTMTPPLTSE